MKRSAAQCVCLLVISTGLVVPGCVAAPWDELKQRGHQAEAFHDFKAAEYFYKEALIQAEKAKMSAQTAEIAARLVELYMAEGRQAESEPLYKKALAIAAEQKKHGFEDRDVLVYMNDLANTYEERADTTQFEKYMLRALEIRKLIFGARHPLVCRALEKLATYYASHNHMIEAEKTIKELISYWQKREGRQNRQRVGIYITLLAQLYLKEKKYGQARALAMQALEIFKSGDVHANVLSLLGETYSQEGRFAEAEEAYKTALHIHEALHGSKSSRLEPDLIGLANLYKKRHQWNELRKVKTHINLIHTAQAHVVRH